ncbi:hypothetical protein [Trinickia symbiotica]|uniref:hypothetical protein n=1 Tax=Trinickia symbiotica TaxID=863227 RepID=UPI000553C75E|nr:hypothetical protein [Trinickia symbiotica]
MKKTNDLSMLAAVALLFCSVFAGCSEETPKSIQDISPSITKVDQSTDGKTITVTIKQDSIFQGGNTTKDVLAGIMQHFKSLPFDKVDVVMNEVLVDQYGRQSVEPIVGLDFPRSEMEKIDFQNVVGWNILNISTPHRIGNQSAHIIETECSEENNAKYAATFCNNAMM